VVAEQCDVDSQRLHICSMTHEASMRDLHNKSRFSGKGLQLHTLCFARKAGQVTERIHCLQGFSREPRTLFGHVERDDLEELFVQRIHCLNGGNDRDLVLH